MLSEQHVAVCSFQYDYNTEHLAVVDFQQTETVIYATHLAVFCLASPLTILTI